MNDIEKQVTELVEPLVQSAGLRLAGVEYVCEENEWFLRVFIDKAEGIDINDCVLISKQLSKLLDEQDFIRDQYYLEVSSPGIPADEGGKIE